MKMRGRLICLVAFVAYIGVILLSDTHSLASSKKHAFKGEAAMVKELFADISTINLLNGLHLTRDQMIRVLDLAREAREAREKLTVGSAEFTQTLKEAEEALQALKDEIMKGTPARGDIPRDAARFKQRLKEMRHRVNSELTETYKELEADLGQVLTPEQIQVVEDFRPCLIPPKDLRNPVRAGQASSNERAIKMLRRLKEMPEDVWQARQERCAQRYVEAMNRHGFPMTAEEMASEKARFMGVVEEARQMSEVEFELEKENIAGRLRPEDRLKQTGRELDRRAVHGRRPEMSKLGRFLLNDRIIPILEQRLDVNTTALENSSGI